MFDAPCKLPPDKSPTITLCEPVRTFPAAEYPTAVLLDPVVPAKAPDPNPELKLVVVMAVQAPLPKAVLLFPVVNAINVACPAPVLALPVVIDCKTYLPSVTFATPEVKEGKDDPNARLSNAKSIVIFGDPTTKFGVALAVVSVFPVKVATPSKKTMPDWLMFKELATGIMFPFLS